MYKVFKKLNIYIYIYKVYGSHKSVSASQDEKHAAFIISNISLLLFSTDKING